MSFLHIWGAEPHSSGKCHINGYPNSKLEITAHPDDTPAMLQGNYVILDKSPYIPGHSLCSHEMKILNIPGF